MENLIINLSNEIEFLENLKKIMEESYKINNTLFKVEKYNTILTRKPYLNLTLIQNKTNNINEHYYGELAQPIIQA